MKTIKTTLCGVALGAIIALPAPAARKCVSLNTNSSCDYHEIHGSPDWSTTCTYASKTVDVRGIGVCSDKKIGDWGAVAPGDISTSENPAENIYCYCKMISPALSKWIQATISVTDSCPYICSMNCLAILSSESAMRKSMFENLE